MTSAANNEWDYEKLMQAIKEMHFGIAALDMVISTNTIEDKESVSSRIAVFRHAIDFIEYNMREMEITGGNGD